MAETTVDAVILPRAPVAVDKPPGYWISVVRRLKHDPVTLFCLAVLVAIVLAAVFAPLVAPHDPYKTSMLRRLAPIGTPGYLLGTDELGRDLLTRLIYGGRISLFMSFTPVLLAFIIGGTLGMIAGFVGGWVNMAIMRTTDVFYAFPSILLAIAISGAMGAGLTNGLISLTLIFIPPLTRIAESVTTQVRSLPYVEAARASGASTFAIIRVHVLTNVVGPVLVYASSLLSVAIVVASGLSFLGLGVSPPEADWGLMLNTLRQSIYVAPWNAALPGAVIFVTCMCFNLLSDGLRQALDIQR
ncbi:peptide/nickel transport system permease protein [Stella humosa]|uniref:Peptide/nickel transport system permease protein n=1 Tax=Stella humosa TaxID=94 RepID=A0A3N1MA46_9PROT|nr:ABC transporter permease [Stella humosa]ROP99914.1 peptide/nickel transport system permease protein [Stella humosa]BBK30856.1 ABC transporter permease [Stella humosa]